MLTAFFIRAGGLTIEGAFDIFVLNTLDCKGDYYAYTQSL